MDSASTDLPVIGRAFERGKRLYFTTTPGDEGYHLVRETDALHAIAAVRRQLDEAHARPAAATTSTTTTAELEVSQLVYLEIAGKLRAAGYDYAVSAAGIELSGLLLTCGAPAGEPSPECDPTDPCAGCRCKFYRGGAL